jgi:quinol monooxygenase YgiN
MSNKKLKSLIALSCNIKIYVPSTVDISVEVDTSKMVDATLTFMSRLFGGSTSYKALGCWQTTTNELVKEKVTICEAFCDSHKLEAHIETVIAFCELMKKDLSQEAIALEVNNVLHFV